MNTNLGISLNRRQMRRVLTAAGLAAPAIALLLVRVILGVQPAPAQAQQPANEPVAVKTPLSPEQMKLATWLRHTRTSGGIAGIRSPMDQMPAPEIEPVKVPEPASKPDPVPEPAATAPKLQLRIGAILSSAERGSTLAVINGKIFSVGDEVETGWRITAMDGDAMSVELTGPQDQVFVLKRDEK